MPPSSLLRLSVLRLCALALCALCSAITRESGADVVVALEKVHQRCHPQPQVPAPHIAHTVLSPVCLSCSC
eukprot:558074-Rhodomonas_salina.1